MKTTRKGFGLALTFALLAIAGCGGQQVTYEDEEAVETLTEDFGSTDVQMMAEEMIDDMNSHPAIQAFQNETKEGQRLIVLLSKVRNKTSEHIDMRNVMNSIRNGLIRSGRFRFAADKERRQDILDEIEYMESGAVDPKQAKAFGKQVGADVFFSGELTSIDKKRDGKRIIHYKLTLMLESIELAEIVWINEKEIRKKRA